jgi:nucleoid DNA-binding protein
MTKADIVDRIAKGTGLTRKETAAVVDGFLAMITYALQSGERIEHSASAGGGKKSWPIRKPAW